MTLVDNSTAKRLGILCFYDKNGRAAKFLDGFHIRCAHVRSGDNAKFAAVLRKLPQLVHNEPQTAPFDEGHQHVDPISRDDFLFELSKHLRLMHSPGEKRALCDGGFRALYVRRCFSYGNRGQPPCMRLRFDSFLCRTMETKKKNIQYGHDLVSRKASPNRNIFVHMNKIIVFLLKIIRKFVLQVNKKDGITGSSANLEGLATTGSKPWRSLQRSCARCV